MSFPHFLFGALGGLPFSALGKGRKSVDDDRIVNKCGIVLVRNRDSGIAVANIVYQLNPDSALAETLVSMEHIRYSWIVGGISPDCGDDFNRVLSGAERAGLKEITSLI